MNAFEEFMFDENYVLRFYRVDHGLVCTINESMVPELREVESKLRQQQAEIQALKQIIDANNLNQNIGQFVKPTNEPVAWMNKTATSWVSTFIYPETEPDEWIPLYTHPVKEQYKFGVDWSKDGNAVTVLKICEDGVAEVVFMDYQEKTTQNIHLTDEEIVGIRMTTEGDIKAFARAILRKAQEK